MFKNKPPSGGGEREEWYKHQSQSKKKELKKVSCGKDQGQTNKKDVQITNDEAKSCQGKPRLFHGSLWTFLTAITVVLGISGVTGLFLYSPGETKAIGVKIVNFLEYYIEVNDSEEEKNKQEDEKPEKKVKTD